MAALPTFLPLPEAARKYGLSQARLRSLVESGKIKAAMIGKNIVVSEDEVKDQAVIRKEDLPEYKKHAYLKGVPIWISEAERKYGIPNPTIWRWMKSGIIARLGMDGNKTLIDEADVAYCAEIYRSRNTKQGRRLFDNNGLPYKPKTGPLAT
ncbi:MAG: helix-turn-helix domain-containing protein [Chloroflexota bacterium]